LRKGFLFLWFFSSWFEHCFFFSYSFQDFDGLLNWTCLCSCSYKFIYSSQNLLFPEFFMFVIVFFVPLCVVFLNYLLQWRLSGHVLPYAYLGKSSISLLVLNDNVAGYIKFDWQLFSFRAELESALEPLVASGSCL
jgi:hypothetical protein